MLTVYGIETLRTYRNILHIFQWGVTALTVSVCAEGCETAEEQSDDEVCTSQVPEQSEGKTKMMKQQHLPFTVLKHYRYSSCNINTNRLKQYLPLTVLKQETPRAKNATR